MPGYGSASINTCTMFHRTASTTALEAVFFIPLSLTLLGSYYGLATPSFALGQAVLSFALLLLLWPRGSAQLSFCTWSTYAKYKTIFLEFCALIYIACAALSLVARVRAKDYSSEVLLILLRKQAITTIGKLDLAACLAILASHITGHHDICNRIHRRVLWLCWSLHKAAQRFCGICYEMLQEPSSDLEAQPNIAAVSLIDLTDPADSLTLPIPLKATPSSSMAMGSLQIQEYADVEEMDDADASKLRERLHLRRTLSSRTNPYPFMHQELRSIGARLRWSNLRYLLGFQKRPLQDVFLFVSSTSSEHHDIETGQEVSIDPQIQLSPRKPRQSKGQNRTLRSVVVEMIDRENLGNHQPRPFDSIEHRHVRKFDGKEGVSDTVSPPVFQLPGTIQNMCVKALPDTGSSQNIIDKSLVQGLSPSVDIGSLDAVDKHLEAPDQEPIPCIGKVRLPWRFNNEEEQYEEWFHVVKDCSKGVILGNGFLQHTETMNKNRRRLEITEPFDPNPLPGNLVNETQQDDCLRELTRGSINGMEVFASLDTGSQANLISVDCAEDLGLEIRPLPTGQEQLKFANGRQVPLLGQVDVQWSFCDTPTEDVNVTLYVLRNCIHPVIFGDRFVYFQDPWVKHSSSLSQMPLETPNIGVVGLASKRRFWGFGTSKQDPVAQQIHDEKKARKERATAALSEIRSESHAQPHTLLRPQPPATPPAAITATSGSTFVQAQGDSNPIVQAVPRIPSPMQASSCLRLPAATGSSASAPSSSSADPMGHISPPTPLPTETHHLTGAAASSAVLQPPAPVITAFQRCNAAAPEDGP